MQSNTSLQMRQTRSLAMTTELRHAIGLLRLNNQQLSAYVAAFAATNPHLHLTRTLQPVQALHWLDSGHLPDGLVRAPGQGALAGSGSARPGGDIDSIADSTTGLRAHVAAQLALLVRDPALAPVALAYLEELEPSGWLACTPAEIARRCRCPPAIAEAVLAQLQQAEPAGLFARSLAECLRLQAADQGLLTPAFARLLAHLDVLARGDLAQLSRHCGCTAEDLALMLRQLRGMNPKPGAEFDAAPEPLREPDLLVRRERGRWLIELNRSTLPEIVVSDDPDAPAGAGEQALRAAHWLQRAVTRRNATTLRIGAEVVRRQSGFLRDGPARLRPLSFADVAAAVGIHVSTVSRVTAGLLVATPRGALPLRGFFSAAVGGSGEGAVATAKLHHDLRRLIASEPAAAPLSDAAIARLFQAQGIALARRTVAKYRAALGITGSAARKRKAVPENTR